jgi:hypothetical protein
VLVLATFAGRDLDARVVGVVGGHPSASAMSSTGTPGPAISAGGSVVAALDLLALFSRWPAADA